MPNAKVLGGKHWNKVIHGNKVACNWAWKVCTPRSWTTKCEPDKESLNSHEEMDASNNAVCLWLFVVQLPICGRYVLPQVQKQLECSAIDAALTQNRQGKNFQIPCINLGTPFATQLQDRDWPAWVKTQDHRCSGLHVHHTVDYMLRQSSGTVVFHLAIWRKGSPVFNFV
jgi:hypothetical protein